MVGSLGLPWVSNQAVLPMASSDFAPSWAHIQANTSSQRVGSDSDGSSSIILVSVSKLKRGSNSSLLTFDVPTQKRTIWGRIPRICWTRLEYQDQVLNPMWSSSPSSGLL